MPNAPWVICQWHITEEEIKVAFVTAFNRLVTEFDERLWGAMVDCVTVGVDKRLTVVFRDGTEVEE